jgi:hypothetical protein
LDHHRRRDDCAGNDGHEHDLFLPLDLAGLIMALWLYLVEIQVVPITSLPTKWFWLLLIWAAIGFVNTLILAYLRKIGVLSGRQSSGDINHY